MNFSITIKPFCMAGYQIKINDTEDFRVEEKNGTLTVNEEAVFPDIVTLSEGCFHVLFHGRSFNVEVIKMDPASRSGQLKVNGSLYTFSARDRFDELLEKMGMAGAAAHKVNDLKAPMPGLVLKTLVASGQEVNKGDQLLVLEAMKMENIIKSPGDGTVKEVLVQPGESVEKNQVLIRFNT